MFISHQQMDVTREGKLGINYVSMPTQSWNTWIDPPSSVTTRKYEVRRAHFILNIGGGWWCSPPSTRLSIVSRCRAARCSRWCSAVNPPECPRSACHDGAHASLRTHTALYSVLSRTHHLFSIWQMAALNHRCRYYSTVLPPFFSLSLATVLTHLFLVTHSLNHSRLILPYVVHQQQKQLRRT